MLVDGPSPEHELVVRGRLEGQAPDIDPQVYLTDCDAAEFTPGDLIQARADRGARVRLGAPRRSADSGLDMLY